MRLCFLVRQDYTNKIEADPLRETFPDFPLPIVLGSTARIVLSTSQSVNESGEGWAELESVSLGASSSSGQRVVSAVGGMYNLLLNVKTDPSNGQWLSIFNVLMTLDISRTCLGHRQHQKPAADSCYFDRYRSGL